MNCCRLTNFLPNPLIASYWILLAVPWDCAPNCKCSDIRTEKDLLSFAKYQRRFIAQAVQLLKPEGRLVYSTCTLHARENEGMVQYILDNHADMHLLPIAIPLGSSVLPGHGISLEDCAKIKRFDPTVAQDTMGFFIASFAKRK